MGMVSSPRQPETNQGTEQHPGQHKEGIVDVEAIHVVREFLLTELAKQMKTLFLSVYHHNNKNIPYEFTMQEVGRRQLKNICLSYLMQLIYAIIVYSERCMFRRLC